MIPDLPRKNDDLNTPEWFVEPVLRVLGEIDFDPCSNPWSVVPAKVKISAHAGQDGLALPWDAYGRKGFVNPPYSRPFLWAVRFAEAARYGVEMIWLGKLDPTTRWANILREARDSQCDLHKRIGFLGGAHKTGMLASSVVYAGPNVELFEDTFRHLGCLHGRRR